MTSRAMFAVMVLVVGPVCVATWILATHTVGESLAPESSTLIGFSVALLAAAAAASLLFLGNVSERPGSHLGRTLIICGTACVLTALSLQFYLAGVVSANFQRVTDLLRERGGNVNMNATFPKSIESVSYFALFAGIWLVAVGIRIGLSRHSLESPGPSAGSGLGGG